MAERIRIATIETGGTWGRLTAWIAEALEGAGLNVEISKRGGEIPETAYRVDGGEADLSVTTTFGARAAYNGKIPYTKRLAISGVAEIQYPLHWFVNMMRADVGISSFEELRQKKPPLRLCLPTPGMLVSYPVIAIFKLFGIDPYADIPKWGGEIITDFNQAPRLIAEGKADGLFRENSPLRYDVSQFREMIFFPMTEEGAKSASEALAIKTGIIKAGTYRNQKTDVLTLDAEGFTFYCPSNLPDEVAYGIARALDHNTQSHYLSSSVFYSPRFAVKTGAPLHPGAAKYYREQGYL